MTFEVIEINKKIAQEMLSRNKENRSISSERVISYARDMKEGRWDENNPQPIILGENDRLLDGQQRLTAICKADVSIKMVVARGVPDATMKVLDFGKARTCGDVLKIHGVQHYNNVAAISKKILAAEKGSGQILSGHYGGTGLTLQSVNNTEATEYALKNLDYLKSLCETSEAIYNNSVVKLLSVSEIGFLLHSLKPYDLAFEFINKVVTGLGVTEKTPELAIRRVLERAKITREMALTPAETLEYVLLAYEKFVRKEQVDFLRIKRFVKAKKDKKNEQ